MAVAMAQQERDLWKAFFVMRRQLELTLERRLQADAGISSADFEILISLFDDAAKRLRAGQIGDIIGWEKSRVSHQISRMEQRGLVKREECGDDARGVWVVLTAEGSRAVLAAASDRSDAIREYFLDVLSDEEKSVLMNISTRVVGKIAPPVCAVVNAEADASA
jgi:DNA-binding MarR family transcriptional regulator